MANDISYFTNIQNDQKNQEAANAAALQAQQNAEEQAARVAFQNNYNEAYNFGINRGRTYLQNRGLYTGSPDQEAMIKSIVDDQAANIPDLDTSPKRYYTDSTFDAGFATNAKATQDALNRQLTGKFGQDYQHTLIPDSSLSDIETSILDPQRTAAYTSLDFNKKRGLLNDMGYNTARTALDSQGEAGRTTLHDIGTSVLNKDRDQIKNIYDDARTAISGYQYGYDQPNLDTFYNNAKTKAGDLIGGLRGSILSATGATNLFDPSVAMQAGGTAQGPINLTTANVGFAPPEKKQQGRGLGSTGLF